MKPFFLLLYWLLVLTLSGSAQPGSRMKSQKDNAATPGTSDLLILVYDKSSSTRLEAAQVAVRQLGFQTKPSAMDGKVLFKNVPVGEVKVTIEKKGYDRIDTLFTVSARIEDNTYTVFLPPEKKVNNSLMISGEVEDERGRDVKGAAIQVEVGEYSASTVSDESGSYKFIINLDILQYNVPDIRFEVKKNGCEYKDRISFPKSNHVSKDVRLVCRDEVIDIPVNAKKSDVGRNSDNNTMGDPDQKKPVTQQNINGVSIKLLSARYSPSYIQCDFQLENISDEYDEINFDVARFNGGKAIGGNGIEYIYSLASIAGSHLDYDISTILYKKVPLKLSIIFDGKSKPKISMIAIFNLPLVINGQSYTLKMTNIKCAE